MAPYLFSGLLDSSLILSGLLSRLSESQWDERNDPDRFTPREVIAHLLDWEPIFRQRMVSTLAEDGFVPTPYDEGERAVELSYETWDFQSSLDDFLTEREITVQWLRQVTPEEMLRCAQHPEWGPMSIQVQMQNLLGHDQYHAKQVLEYLA